MNKRLSMKLPGKTVFTDAQLMKFLFLIWMIGFCAFHGADDISVLFRRVARVVYFGTGILFIVKYRSVYKIGSRSMVVYYFLFILYAAMSVLWASDFTDALSESYIDGYSQILLGAFILDKYIKTKEDARDYSRLLLASLTIMLVRLILITPAADWGARRIGSSVGWYPTSFGAVCVHGVFLAFFCADDNKYLYLLSIAFGVCALFTGSRGPVIILVIGAFIFAVWKNRGVKRIRNILLISLIFMVSIHYIFSNAQLYHVLGRRIELMLYEYGLSSKTSFYDISVSERTFFREYAISMFLNKPLFGYGSNGFVSEMRRIGYSHVTYSHNTYTEILATYGIAGFMLYYVYKIRTLVFGLKEYMRNRKSDTLFAITTIILMLVREFIGITFYECFAQVMFIISLKLLYLGNANEGEIE